MSYPASHNHDTVDVTLASYGSELYWKTIEIRRKVLRLPLGLDFTDADLRDDPANHHFLATVHNVAVGALVLVPETQGCGKIRQVAVLDDYRGAGIGKALMEAAHKQALQLGMYYVHLHARITAIEFYLRLGYQRRGEMFDEIGILHQDMFLELKPQR